MSWIKRDTSINVGKPQEVSRIRCSEIYALTRPLKTTCRCSVVSSFLRDMRVGVAVAHERYACSFGRDAPDALRVKHKGVSTYGKFPALRSAYKPFMLNLTYRLLRSRRSSCARLRLAIHGGGGAMRTCSASSIFLMRACPPGRSEDRVAWQIVCEGRRCGRKFAVAREGRTGVVRSSRLIDSQPCVRPLQIHNFCQNPAVSTKSWTEQFRTSL
jgi:hypothetical protein